jgi:polysaccharide deacetylase family protein (PEP-CTERM system associated)
MKERHDSSPIHPGPTNALSIDVEDYYQVSAFEPIVRYEDWGKHESRVFGNTVRVLELLHHHGVKATFFVLGWIGEYMPKVVREIAEAGHEVACHSYNHRLVYSLSRNAFREDLHRTKAILEDIIGVPVAGYRAPSYSIVRESLWALEELMDAGFLYDSSIFPIRHDRYGLPGYPRHIYRFERNGKTLIEFPPSTVRIGRVNIPIAGGGYLRLFPYAFTRWSIQRLNRVENEPALIYFHPWEIDYNQPRLNGGSVSNARHYLNLGSTESTLRRLLRDFSFSPIRVLCEQRNGSIMTIKRLD